MMDAIQAFMDEHGISPTVQELADALEIKGATVHEQLRKLVEKGYLRRMPRKARSLEIIQRDAQPTQLVPVPIVGKVAAGFPILAQENVVGEVLMESNVARGRCFALEVQGDSMIEAEIHEGDLLIVRQQPLAENGDIVVALLGEEATVKRLFISGEQIELRPANSAYAPIEIAPDDELKILGKVLAVRGQTKSFDN
uniref:LexA repressor n=1 Tax=Magnetococcus massalia (strain MO-1) TaxID=451514 RepID=A0A1S7LGW0_MAGMO|nr:LexA repressor [Candidatus Magnetococcus massalia]